MRRPRLGTVLLTLWAALLTVFVCAYVAWLQPTRLAGTVSSILESTLKVRCDMGTLSLSLLPMPTVTIDKLALRRGAVEHLELSVFFLPGFRPAPENSPPDAPAPPSPAYRRTRR